MTHTKHCGEKDHLLMIINFSFCHNVSNSINSLNFGFTLFPQYCQCHLLQVWGMLKRVKFSPLPDVNDLMSVTLNSYLLCWFLICKTWNRISLFVNRYKFKQLIMYTCIWNISFGNRDSEGYDHTLKMCSFSESSMMIKFLFLIMKCFH